MILNEREAQVLKMRFGIGMNTDHTLADVAKQLGLSRERVRQIEASGIRKLRESGVMDGWSGFEMKN